MRRGGASSRRARQAGLTMSEKTDYGAENSSQEESSLEDLNSWKSSVQVCTKKDTGYAYEEKALIELGGSVWSATDDHLVLRARVGLRLYRNTWRNSAERVKKRSPLEKPDAAIDVYSIEEELKGMQSDNTHITVQSPRKEPEFVTVFDGKDQKMMMADDDYEAGAGAKAGRNRKDNGSRRAQRRKFIRESDSFMKDEGVADEGDIKSSEDYNSEAESQKKQLWTEPLEGDSKIRKEAGDSHITNIKTRSRSKRVREEDMSIIPKVLLYEDHKVVSGIYDALEIKASKIHGVGVFSTVGIDEKTFLMSYEGEIIGKCLSDKREKLYMKHGIKSVYMFKVDDDKIIDATLVGNKARFINHSCDPNCYSVTDGTRQTVLYFTKSRIHPGDELTIDYHFTEDNVNEICNCGSTSCSRSKS